MKTLLVSLIAICSSVLLGCTSEASAAVTEQAAPITKPTKVLPTSATYSLPVVRPTA